MLRALAGRWRLPQRQCNQFGPGIQYYGKLNKTRPCETCSMFTYISDETPVVPVQCDPGGGMFA